MAPYKYSFDRRGEVTDRRKLKVHGFAWQNLIAGGMQESYSILPYAQCIKYFREVVG